MRGRTQLGAQSYRREFITRGAEVRQQVAETAKTAPLFALLTKTIHAANHVAGKVGDAATDETGALLFDANALGRWQCACKRRSYRMLARRSEFARQYVGDAGEVERPVSRRLVQLVELARERP